ncbi:uncharacterized protein MAM_00570 [Metarhizium album ARSEF 1941]|uniref:Cyclin-D1-binding protein 1-like N-terminal domain-containing protein n=1 Tax=Metarhizium album (strain ARSEF 1941) TaxID=1081103 RepID=A0A0B2X5B6_METAS|nr:uncharacterized protein MAM_00570 [Metarhizium album ARSEF 1941]KHO01569.1 hypothetical protein MAM_00570 [Metarhizium album ARSEF 1941]
MPPKDKDAIEALAALVQTSSALLDQLQAVLSETHKAPDSATSSSPSPSPQPDPNFNALSLAHASASLIRAHGTKISLLIITEPFAPSAVSAVVRELVAGPVPGLVSAAEACVAKQYTGTVRRELAWRARRVLSGLGQLLHKIPNDGKLVAQDERDAFAKGERGSLPATGLLWSACDSVTDLSNMGVAGFFIHKVDQWRDILNDVMDEMREWGDEEADSDSDSDPVLDGHVDNPSDQPGSESLSAQAMLDSLVNSHQTIPSSDPDRIRPRLESSLKRLRLVTLLYRALAKRRLKRLPAFPPANAASDVPSRLDEMAKLLAELPDSFGDLACAFYELQPSEIDKTTERCFRDAFAASELFVNDWDNKRDSFSEWTETFQAEIQKI